MNFINQSSTLDQDTRINKIALTLIFIGILFILYILIDMPAASGYEVSIYEAFSPDFWFLYILIIFSSIGLSFHSILKNTNWWKGYLAIILIMNLLVLFLPIIRGYEFYGRGGSDVYYHLAGAKHILNTGLIMESDFYPIIHIITAILNIIGLSDSLHLTTIISSTFYIVYLFSLYALGRAMMKSERGGALLAIFGSPFLFSFGHFAFYPFLFSLFLLPLVLYCICGANCIDKKIDIISVLSRLYYLLFSAIQ